MIKLSLYNSKVKLPNADYVLEEQNDLEDILNVITPKFSGSWEILVIDAKIKFVKDFIEEDNTPEWITINFYLNRAKLNEILLVYPKYAPREKTKKEYFNEMIASLNHLVDEPARKALYKALGSDTEKLKEVVTKLDKECNSVSISLKDVQSAVNYSKKVYASEVVNAFLLRDRYRWRLLNRLTRELGMEYAYHAVYKYVRKLLSEKNSYLQNNDVTNYVISRIDAPLICYTYVLFSNSTHYKQLYGLMYDIDNRGPKAIERILL